MKSVGIVRKVDELGRIVIPVELRRKFGIDIKDSMEIYTEDNCIILKKYEPSCIFCGDAKKDVYKRQPLAASTACGRHTNGVQQTTSHSEPFVASITSLM